MLEQGLPHLTVALNELEAIKAAAFALETMAHLQGREREVLPLAEGLRAIQERFEGSPRTCTCGRQKWGKDVIEIRDSRGTMHYANRPCF